MARVLLIMPRLPQALGAPYLGQMYVASRLLADGHEVRCLDLAARWGRADDDVAIEIAERFQPDLIGMTLFTYNAARAYELAHKLRGRARMLVAGGPHPTVCRTEPLDHGFDVAVAGEGEPVIAALAHHLDGTTTDGLAAIAGVTFRGGSGPCRSAIADLDALPWPHFAAGCWDRSAYSSPGSPIMPLPGGVMTSRGCPARCTFCANYVTGRAYRYRSSADVVAEMVALRLQQGVATFSFWDDAFTALRPRLYDLCDAIQAEPELDGITWSCITPANMVRPPDLTRMREAGCISVNFGIESGDAEVLRFMKKGQRPTQVKEAVESAQGEGMQTVVNFMFGFPGEGIAELEATAELMAELSASTDYFNTRGVLVPFPGTGIYDDHHIEYGFTDWWLDPARIPADPDDTDPASAERDPTLDVDFFRYSDAVRERIAECVRFKALHNRRTVGRLQAGYSSGNASPTSRR